MKEDQGVGAHPASQDRVLGLRPGASSESPPSVTPALRAARRALAGCYPFPQPDTLAGKRDDSRNMELVLAGVYAGMALAGSMPTPAREEAA